MSMRAPALDLPVRLDNVRVVAGTVAILDGITLTLEPGTPTVLIGPNGAGKTTLLRVVMGLTRPTGGRISWGGREQAAPARRSIMLQRPAMLRRSAAANIRYALAAAGMPRDERAARVTHLMADVGLAGLEQRPARRLSSGRAAAAGAGARARPQSHTSAP